MREEARRSAERTPRPGLSRFRKLRAATSGRPSARSLVSFRVAGNFTVIYDGRMNPHPRAVLGTRTSLLARERINSIRD